MKLLIIEPDKTLRLPLEGFLTQENYTWESVNGYHLASEKINLYEYDCIILNSKLPDGNSLSLLKELNETRKSDGVIIVSTDSSPEDRVVALDLGADDYLSIPFHLPELNARIQAIIRRKKFNTKNKLHLGNLIIDFKSKQVQVWNSVIPFTKREHEILLYLIANKEKVVSNTMISEYLWGEETDHRESNNSLAAHIKNVRKKLNLAKAELEIKNIYGVGYQIIEI
jgi:two-component system response regulator ArlR